MEKPFPACVLLRVSPVRRVFFLQKHGSESLCPERAPDSGDELEEAARTRV